MRTTSIFVVRFVVVGCILNIPSLNRTPLNRTLLPTPFLTCPFNHSKSVSRCFNHRSRGIHVKIANHPTQYVLLLLNHCPYLHSRTGAAIPSVSAMNANKLFPQPTPSLSYMAGAKSGNEKPHIVLTNAAAPVADAAYVCRSCKSVKYPLCSVNCLVRYLQYRYPQHIPAHS